MVATDVASRGIGMIDHRTSFHIPFPFFPLLSCVALFMLPYSLLSCVLSMPSLVKASHVVLLVHFLENLGCQMQCSLLRFFIPSRCVPTGYRGGANPS